MSDALAGVKKAGENLAGAAESNIPSDYIQYTNYNKIAGQIDQLYSRTYFQGNAFYPTVLCYANGTNNTDKVPLSLLDEKKFKDIKSIEDYLKAETESIQVQTFLSSGDLALFNKINLPSLASIPLQKNKSVLKSDNGGNRASSDTVNLTFLWDRESTVLSFIDNWRQEWYINTDRQRILQPLDIGKNPPEGYFGLCYCAIDNIGNITPVGHLSCFGLIPKLVEFDPKDIGPMSTPSGLAKITVHCIYSFITYVYEGYKINDTDGKREDSLKRIFLGS